MPIKTTPKQIDLASAALKALLAVPKMPPKASYAVGKLARTCQAEMEEFVAARQKIFTDAGCTEKSGQFVHEDPEALKAAVKAADELAGVEVELSALPLDLEQFGNADLPGNAFYGLDWAMKPVEAL